MAAQGVPKLPWVACSAACGFQYPEKMLLHWAMLECKPTFPNPSTAYKTIIKIVYYNKHIN